VDDRDYETVEAFDADGRHVTRIVHHEPPASDMTLIATAELDALREALKACQNILVFHARDWGAGASDAMLWGILVGWECDDQHEHDEFCGADGGALAEVTVRHRWDQAAVARMRRLHRAVATIGAGA
jgi:hypothetical protein